VTVTPSAKIRVRVQPRARRDEIVGERDGVLVVRVAAPPLEGRANDAVCRLLAKRAGVGRTRVTVLQGERSRDKLVRIEGVTEEELRSVFEMRPEGDKR
jgi:uncharacterized protein (TIGR00251 family)